MSSDEGSSESQSYTALTPQHFALRRSIGRLSTNPFLNFLASLRPKMKDVAAHTIVDRAMRLWSKMDSKERKPYNDMARLARQTKAAGPGARVRRNVGRSRKQQGRSRNRKGSRRRRSRSNRRNRTQRRGDTRRKPRRDRHPAMQIRRRL